MVETLTRKKESGQAMVEFALTLPILLFFVLGIIDFGVALFTYSQASDGLRNALRRAEIIGYITKDDTPPYLDCAKMAEIASRTWFTTSDNVDITYIKADNPSVTYNCDTVSAGVLENGDILQIHLTANVHPFFLPIGDLKLEFEGQRGILRSIPVTPIDPDSPGGGGGSYPVPIPPAPTDFDATIDCATGEVTFTWNWGTTSPLPIRAEIRDVADDSVVINFSGDMSTPVCDGTCHDTLPMPGGSRNYYIVAINGTGSSEKVSEHSNTDAVTCSVSDPELPVPPAPINFVAYKDCTTGHVTFTWNWGSISPMPTRAEIRDASTGEVRVNYTGVMDPPSCIGSCFDAMPVPGSRDYYIVAINGTPPNEKVSDPSYLSGVSCTEAEISTGVVQVELLESKNTGICAWSGNAFGGKTVTLRNLTNSTQQSLASDAFGEIVFSSLPPADYQLVLPNTLTVHPKTYHLLSVNSGTTCQTMTGNTFNFTLTAGQELQFTFGYR